ncbi:MAG: helix-turn-helix domain-containing protein [Ignavibacteria bacterium]|nr:helix-turn-helix domain-containing protein [Ignavibacteria bacterium]
MKIKPIKTKRDHENALERIQQLWGCKKNTSQGDEFEVLVTLVEKYEDEHYPIPPPDPIEAIKFRMEHMNLSRKELAKIVGYKSRVSEVLSGKRKLSLPMIRRLNKELNIPAETLIREY